VCSSWHYLSGVKPTDSADTVGTTSVLADILFVMSSDDVPPAEFLASDPDPESAAVGRRAVDAAASLGLDDHRVDDQAELIDVDRDVYDRLLRPENVVDVTFVISSETQPAGTVYVTAETPLEVTRGVQLKPSGGPTPIETREATLEALIKINPLSEGTIESVRLMTSEDPFCVP
jgi:hypothetical protein